MDATAADWWGLQATKGLAKTRDVPSNGFTEPIPMATLSDGLLDEFEQDAIYDFHVGSYFVAYRRPVLDDPRFRAILDSVAPERGKLAVIQKYEIGLTHFLIGHGYAFATYADRLYPFHPLFSEWHFTLIERGFPLLKKYFIYQNHYDVPDLADWKARVAALVPDAPLDVFEADLLRTSPDDRLRRSFAIRRGRRRHRRGPDAAGRPDLPARRPPGHGPRRPVGLPGLPHATTGCRRAAARSWRRCAATRR